MTEATQAANRDATSALDAKNVIALAIWFGVVTGVVEGGLLLTLQTLRRLSWTMMRLSVSIEIVWIAIAVDLLLVLAVVVTVTALGRCFPRLNVLRWSVFLLAWLACFDWLALTARLHTYAALTLGGGLASVAMRSFSQHEAWTLRFARRGLPWVIATVLLAVVGIEGSLWLKERIATARLPAAPPNSPNVLVIVVDTLRADHLSGYGYARATSPNLDRIGEQGVLFENAFAASSWTLPSHASLLTGRYQYEYGANGNYNDGRFFNIAQALRADGYRTGAFSANTLYFCRAFGFGRGFLHFEDYFSSWADMYSRTLYGRKFNQFVVRKLGYRDEPGRKGAREVNREFLRWVDRSPKTHFFAFLNYWDVHLPYLPPQPYGSLFTNPNKAHQNGLGDLTDEATDQDQATNVSRAQLRSGRDAYDGAIAYVDAQIGQLISELEARGLAANTLIVITSDHGEELGEHGLHGHSASLYRQEVHVPLIFWWPGHVPAGIRLSTPVSNVALPQTIVDFVDHGEQNRFPRRSLAQLWNASAPAPEWREPITELARMPYDPQDRHPFAHWGMKSLISGDWQYIKHDDSREELYDWKNDPEELHNLADTSEGQSLDPNFLARLENRVGHSFEKSEVAKPVPAEEPKLVGSHLISPSAQLH